jgi:hypothetical protein
MKLSAEILFINKYASLFHKSSKREPAIQYMICLDFLLKGMLIHWSVKLNEKTTTKSPKEQLMLNDVKFPILLGD